MRIRGEEIKKVTIEGKTYSVYISYPKRPGQDLPELRIGPLDMIKGGIDETIAEKVIKEVSGELKFDNFGEFNKVDQRRVFTIKISRPRSPEEYCELKIHFPDEAFEKELNETKEKLFQAVRKLHNAFNRLADMALVP